MTLPQGAASVPAPSPGPTSAPDISVIVIVYNDAHRLPNAVRSVLDQTLNGLEVIIVDDASTDDSPRVADELAAAHPDRVRAIHLPENSGGCSRPRNVGIDDARGTYVLFLDSDDTIDRHACMTLLDAAEETGADLVAGLTVREMVDTGREVRWFPHLYQRRAVYASLHEHPDQLDDMLSTNKLYRRDFLNAHGLRFPEGLRYEDILFIAHAYLVANKIAIVPHRIYNWRVERKKGNLSISNLRGDLRNFSDRLEIHRRIDALYREHGADDLKLRKDTRFLDHDLLMHVRDLPYQDDEYRRRFQELAGDYLTGLDPRAFEKAVRTKAIMGYLLRAGDVAGSVAAADWTPPKGQRPKLMAPLAERDGHVFWDEEHLDGDEHLDAGRARRVLDVTELGLHQRPLSELNIGNELTELTVHGEGRNAGLRFAGRMVNPLGRIRPEARLKCVLQFSDRRRPGRTFGVPAVVRHGDGWIAWTADVLPARTLRPLGLVDPIWDVRLRLTVAGTGPDAGPGAGKSAGNDETIVTALTTHSAAHEGVTAPVRPRLGRLTADRLEARVDGKGELSFRLAAHGGAARVTAALLRRIVSTGLGSRARSVIGGALRTARKAAGHRRSKELLYRRLFTRLPVRKKMIFFESDRGRAYAGNPRFIYEELRGSGRPYDVVWSYAGSSRGFPKDKRVKLVKRGSWAYYRALARARFWVDDRGVSGELPKRPQTTYLQTWHGSPVKRMGLDRPALKTSSRAVQRCVERETARYDYFLVRSEHDVRTLGPAFRITAEPLRVGYPRNDALLAGGDPKSLAALRKRLGLGAGAGKGAGDGAGDGRTVVLYAPTFRDNPQGRPVKKFELEIDLDRFAAEFGDTHVLLMRPHPGTTVVVPPRLRRAVRHVGAEDLSELMLLSDVLITDYSSVLFDFLLLDRPVLCFAPDIDDYVERGRGLYVDLAEDGPGPLLRDEQTLYTTLRDLDGVRERYAKARRRFVEEYGEYDTGTAAKAVVEQLFNSGGRGE